MKQKITILVVLILLAGGVMNLFSHMEVRQTRKDLWLTFQSPGSRLSPDLAKILAGEFKGLLADYLLLEVGSFIGSNQEGSAEDWRNVHQTLELAMALDPYFQQTYLYAQGSLPWQAKIPAETIELLEIARRHRPWDWFPGQYIGFDYYYFFNDYAKASEVFLETAKIEGAPVLLAVLGGRFALRSQRTEAAIALLEEMLAGKSHDNYTHQEIEARITALKDILVLERSIVSYRQHHGENPPSLATLVDAGLVDHIPPNPYAPEYFYDPQTGQVAFDKVR